MKRLNFAVLLIAAACLAGCGTSSSEAERVLSAQGFTNIETTGFAFIGCDEKDTFRTGFEATSPTGVRVSGVVCSGLLKGATVRFK